MTARIITARLRRGFGGQAVGIAAVVLALLSAACATEPPERPSITMPAALARICNAADTVAAVLRDQWGEKPVEFGITEGGSLMQLFVSRNGTWSLIATGTNGVSCLVAAGKDWSGPMKDRGI